MKKIIISDAVDKKSAALLQSAGYEVDYHPGIPPDELSKIINQYNVLIVRSETNVDADLISKMDKMEIIGRAGTGTDNIDVDAATRKGIIVMNTPGGNTISTAEHTIAMILSLCRNIPQADHSLREGKWERKSFKGTELSGKTLGILGLGKIGKEVALRCKAFGMEIIGYDPVLSEEVTLRAGIKPVDLNTLLRTSDIITIHVPLNSETRHLISKETLKKCKDGVRIINCARGGIVSEKDLIEALNSGKVAGAALDVFEDEPPGSESEVVLDHRIVITPHLGASTGEAQEKVAVQIADQIIKYFSEGALHGGVNADAIISFSNEDIIPYVNLIEKIGKMQSQLLQGHLKQFNVTFSGDLLHEFTNQLGASLLKGFLTPLKTESINLVNAPFIAKEMGVTVNVTKSAENTTYMNLISVICSSENEKRCISGTVFGRSELRLVEIDEYSLEVIPEGWILLYKNIDKPGILAAVTGLLAGKKLNIGSLSLGRNEERKEALTMISVDGTITPELLKDISMISGIKVVHAVNI